MRDYLFKHIYNFASSTPIYKSLPIMEELKQLYKEENIVNDTRNYVKRLKNY